MQSHKRLKLAVGYFCSFPVSQIQPTQIPLKIHCASHGLSEKHAVRMIDVNSIIFER